MNPSEPKPQRQRKTRYSVLLLTLLFLATAVGCGYFYHAYRHAVAANPTSQQASIVSQVKALALTPNEQPQIATVKDASKLASSVLAKKTQNGDVLLVYGTAKRIIVYRPSTKKIVDMLTVQMPASTASTGATSSATSAAKQ